MIPVDLRICPTIALLCRRFPNPPELHDGWVLEARKQKAEKRSRQRWASVSDGEGEMASGVWRQKAKGVAPHTQAQPARQPIIPSRVKRYVPSHGPPFPTSTFSLSSFGFDASLLRADLLASSLYVHHHLHHCYGPHQLPTRTSHTRTPLLTATPLVGCITHRAPPALPHHRLFAFYAYALQNLPIHQPAFLAVRAVTIRPLPSSLTFHIHLWRHIVAAW